MPPMVDYQWWHHWWRLVNVGLQPIVFRRILHQIRHFSGGRNLHNTSQWCCMSNKLSQITTLFSIGFKFKTKKWRRNPHVTGCSLYKGAVMRKSFPCREIIIIKQAHFGITDKKKPYKCFWGNLQCVSNNASDSNIWKISPHIWCGKHVLQAALWPKTYTWLNLYYSPKLDLSYGCRLI